MKATQAVKTKQAKQSIWTPAFLAICLISIMMNLSKQMSNSIVSKYADSLGAPATLVGLVASAFALAALVFKLVSGPALDSFNRKYILFGAMLVMGTAFTGYAFSSTVPSIIAFRFLQGAAQAFTATCLLTLVSDILPSDQFSTGVGFFALAESVAQAIGPTVGLTLMDYIGYQKTFFMAAAMMILAAFITLTCSLSYTKTTPFQISLKRVIAKECIPVAVLLLIFNFTFCVVSSFLAIYSGQVGVRNIGTFFTLQACVLMISRPTIGKLSDKFGVVKTVLPGMLCFIIAYWIISVSSQLWMFLVAALFSAFGFGACQPAVQALCMKCVPKERRGAASSTCYIAQDIGNLLGPIFGGWIVEQMGYTSMWRIMTIPVVIAIVYLLAVQKKVKDIEDSFLKS